MLPLTQTIDSITICVTGIHFQVVCHSSSRYFPHSTKAGWQANYSDFLFAAIQMNLYTLFHEVNDEILPKNKQLTLKAFTSEVIQLLMRQIVIHETRPYKKSGKYM